MKIFSAVLLLCLVFAGNALSTEVHYRESIDAESTFRITRSFEDSILTLWESTLPGDSRFGQPLDTITFYHSIEAIDPPLLPDGTVRLLQLKLHLRDSRSRDITLTVDSIGLGKVHRRHFLIGPESDDWLIVYETILADGQIMVTLESGTGDDDHDDDCDDDEENGDEDDDDDGHSEDVEDDDDDEGDGDDDDCDDDGDSDGISGQTLDDAVVSGISLSPGSGQFELKRSVMDVVYQPAIPMDVADSRGSMPADHFLSANYPNPFNPSTTIEYNLPTRSQVRVEVLNALGQTVRVLVDAPVSAGLHWVVWDGQSQGGTPVASGVYYYRIVAGDIVNARKMILMK